MLPDYHIHTRHCGHAEGRAVDYAREALARGIKEVGFADHLPNFYLPSDSPYGYLRRPLDQIEGYLADVEEARRRHPQLTIKLGVEVDYLPGKEAEIAQALAGLPLDYAIGSVHFVGGWSLYDPEYYRRFSPEHIYKEYFAVLHEAVSCGLFQIIGHFDLPKLYCPPPRPMLELAQPALESLAASDLCLEINCGALRAGLGEPFPGYEIIRWCQGEGVPITLGSDAHKPEQVGQGFASVKKPLMDLGYHEAAVFCKGVRSFVPLVGGSSRQYNKL